MTSLQREILCAQFLQLARTQRALRFFFTEAGPDGAPLLLLGERRVDTSALVAAMRSAGVRSLQAGKVKPMPDGLGLIFRVKMVTASAFAEHLFGCLAEQHPILAASAFLVEGLAPVGPGAVRLRRNTAQAA
jgi:hypothetical protein